jgi:hypothetical protein
MWIRNDGAFDPIIPPKLFAKAQALRAKRRRRCRRILPNQQALDELSALLVKEGRLSRDMIGKSREVPCPTTLIKRFGSLAAAYDLVGFKLVARYRYSESRKRIVSIIDRETGKLLAHMGSRGLKAAVGDVFQIVVNDDFVVSVCVAVAVAHLPGKKRWQLRWAKRGARSAPSVVSLVIKLDETNTKVSQFFLLPMTAIELARLSDQRLRVSTRVFAEDYKHSDLESVAAAISRSVA